MNSVEYPKPIMRINELQELGFTKEYLKNVFADPNQDFAWKMDMTKKNSTILFDTVGFEKYRQNQVAMQQKARKHRVAII